MNDDNIGAKGSLDFGLIANFVHQVINPLNGVSGTLDNILDGTISVSRRDQRLRAARAQLENSILLIRNLAYFSELELNPADANPGKINKTCVMPQIIIEAAMFFQELGASKKIEIHLEDRATQYKVKGNPDLLRQVFMNIFDNAVKYGLVDTRVVVTPWIQKKTDNLLVRISGKSVPIARDEITQLFTLGFRGNAAREKIASGTGLGLYICKTILERVHNGEISVETSKSSGDVSFLIKFPSVFI